VAWSQKSGGGDEKGKVGYVKNNNGKNRGKKKVGLLIWGVVLVDTEQSPFLDKNGKVQTPESRLYRGGEGVKRKKRDPDVEKKGPFPRPVAQGQKTTHPTKQPKKKAHGKREQIATPLNRRPQHRKTQKKSPKSAPKKEPSTCCSNRWQNLKKRKCRGGGKGGFLLGNPILNPAKLR